jgi:anti-sigma B factor antagonist
MAPVADPRYLPAVVLELPAQIDMANVGRVGQQPGSAFAAGVKTVIAGMTANRFCGSSGISMLVRAHTQAAANGTRLRLAVRSTSVLRALTLVRMDYLPPVYPTLSQALAGRPAPGPRTTSDHGLPEVPEAVNAAPGYPGGAPAAPPEATTSRQAARGTAPARSGHQR